MPFDPIATNVPPARIRRTIARALLKHPEGLRLAVLAVIDQKSRETGDLSLLRECRTVRANLLRYLERGLPF